MVNDEPDRLAEALGAGTMPVAGDNEHGRIARGRHDLVSALPAAQDPAGGAAEPYLCRVKQIARRRLRDRREPLGRIVPGTAEHAAERAMGRLGRAGVDDRQEREVGPGGCQRSCGIDAGLPRVLGHPYQNGHVPQCDAEAALGHARCRGWRVREPAA